MVGIANCAKVHIPSHKGDAAAAIRGDMKLVRRGVALLLVAVLAMSFVVSVGMIDVTKTTEIIGKPRMYEISYDSHAPFNVTSNIDFETQGWPGNGSVTNPYRIQNLNITSTNSTCIWIMNTTSHFIIEECLFVSPIENYSSGQPICPITLTNVSNGKVERNHILDSFTAVSGYQVSNCSISDNTLSVSHQGISITMSNSTVISNNTQGYEPCINGITAASCRNCTISLNEFKNITIAGLYSWGNYDVHIVENSFSGSTNEDAFSHAGIQVNGEFCTIQRNVVSDFKFWGIDVSGRNFTVKENNITSCQTGIVVSTNNSTIIGNTINGSFSAIEMVQANNTKVHGNSIIGRGAYETGIAIYDGYDCDIYSNTISRVYLGIYLQGATRFNVSSNSVTDCRYGFAFGWASNWGVHEQPAFDCDIVDNTFDGGGVYPIIENYGSWEFDTIRFIGNTVHGEPIGFFTNRDQETIDGNTFGQLLLVSCNEITISGGNFHDISSDRVHDIYYDSGVASAITLVNCTSCNLANINFHNNTYGITLQDSSQCDITGGSWNYNSWRAISLSYSNDIDIVDIEIRNSSLGIELIRSNECSIAYCQIWNNLRGVDASWSYNLLLSNCQIRNNEEGVVLKIGMNCTISQNTIFENIDGMYLEDSDGSEIWGNAIYWNDRGVLLNSSSDCMISQNNIYNNTGVGIALDTTANHNEIFNNIFAFNTPNAICEGSLNHWDNQVDTGNLWSDYGGEGPYIIDENDQDNFPLVIETITTNGTVPISPWPFDPLLLGIVGGIVGIIALVIILVDRRRVVVTD